MSAVTKLDKVETPLTDQFEDLFREHYQLVYRTACAVTGSPEDAEDIVQTIFLRLLRREVRPDFHENPKGYFYKAAINLSLNTIRLRNRQIQVGNAEAFADSRRTNSSGVDEWIRRRVNEALATLSPRSVEILILRYVYDYTEPQIATMLRRSRGTIAVTLFRSRARLRKLLLSIGDRV
jgi:RNA polymerase sigma-70 factor (ECF subfamily)